MSSVSGQSAREDAGSRPTRGFASLAISVGVLALLAVAAWSAERVGPGAGALSTSGMTLGDLVCLGLMVVAAPAFLLSRASNREPAGLVLKGLIWGCAGALICRLMTPPGHHAMRSLLDTIRWIKWPVAIIVEAQVAFLVYKVVVQQKRTVDAAVDDLVASGKIHPLVAKLARWEGRMWRYLFRKTVGRFTRASDSAQPRRELDRA